MNKGNIFRAWLCLGICITGFFNVVSARSGPGDSLPSRPEIVGLILGDIEPGYPIPAQELYQTWITDDIHPYQFDPKEFNDTVLINLVDSTDCPFSMPVLGEVTSCFGYRWSRYHYGIDLELDNGDPVYC